MNEYGLIKIYNKLFVGFQERSRTEIIEEGEEGYVAGQYKRRYFPYVLGFVTPYEENAAGRKRQDTVTRWANERNYTYEIQPDGSYKHVRKEKPESLKEKVIENTPREGFTLAEEVRRTYWGGGNVVWRIVDPAGFEFEISSANLARIITEVGLEPGGKIPGKCVYGRLGKDNILIPEGTELWKRSFKDAEELERKSKTVGKTLVVPGAVCEMKTGDHMVYLGQFWITDIRTPEFEDERRSNYGYHYNALTLDQIMATSKNDLYTSVVQQYHAFKTKTSSQIYLYREKKVVSVTSTDEKFEDINKNLEFINSTKQISYAGSGKYAYSTVAFVATIKKPDGFSFEKVALSESEIKKAGEIDRYGTLQFKLNPSCTEYDIVVINELGEIFNTMKVLYQRGEEQKDARGYAKYTAENLKVVVGGKIDTDQKRRYCNTTISSGRLSYGYNWQHKNGWNYIYGIENSQIIDAGEILRQAVEEFKQRYSLFKVVAKVGDSESLVYSR